MVKMKVLPVETALVWVRAWTELEWPVSWETAFALRDQLGWVPDPEEGRYFTTFLSSDPKHIDGTLRKIDGHFSSVAFPLVTDVLQGEKDENTEPVTWAAYEEFLGVFRGLFGEPYVSRDYVARGHRHLNNTWLLGNGSSVSMGGIPGILNVVVESPWLTQLMLDDARLREKYGEDYEDLEW